MNFFLFKRKESFEMRISDWSSDVCSSDLVAHQLEAWIGNQGRAGVGNQRQRLAAGHRLQQAAAVAFAGMIVVGGERRGDALGAQQLAGDTGVLDRRSVVTGKSVSVRVDLGGRRIIKKNNISTKKIR